VETRRLRRIRPQPTPVRSRGWQRRQNVAPGQHGDREEIGGLLKVLARERSFRLPVLPRKCGMPAIFLCVCVCVVTAEVIGVPMKLRPTGIAVLSCVFGMLLSRLMVSQRQSLALRQLTGTDDLRAIGPLVSALSWPETSLRRAAAAALTRLLPQLQEPDAVLLDAATRRLLNRRLARSKAVREPGLALAILTALAQVGDRHAIEYVRPLTCLRVRTETEQRLKLPARACLSSISARLNVEPSDCAELVGCHDLDRGEGPSDVSAMRGEEATCMPILSGIAPGPMRPGEFRRSDDNLQNTS